MVLYVAGPEGKTDTLFVHRVVSFVCGGLFWWGFFWFFKEGTLTPPKCN